MAVDIIARAMAAEALSGQGGGGGSSSATNQIGKQTISWQANASLSSLVSQFSAITDTVIGINFVSPVGERQITVVGTSGSFSFFAIEVKWESEVIINGYVSITSESETNLYSASLLLSQGILVILNNSNYSDSLEVNMTSSLFVAAGQINVFTIGLNPPSIANEYVTQSQFTPIATIVEELNSSLNQEGTSVLLVRD